LTVGKNLTKINRTNLGIVAEFRPLWYTALPHPAPKGGKKKKKGKKGKKK
jgi:hypothetical protein